MAIEIECYFRDQILRGEFPAAQGRPLDLLNTPMQKFVILHNTYSASLHVASPATWLGKVRVEKDRILLVVPYDEPMRAKGPIRGGWVEKRTAQVVVNVGPLLVTGTLYVGQREYVAIESIGRDVDGRPFIPATVARISSAYHPDWSVEVDSAFIARSAMNYIALISPPDEPLPRDPRPADAVYRAPRPSSIAR